MVLHSTLSGVHNHQPLGASPYPLNLIAASTTAYRVNESDGSTIIEQIDTSSRSFVVGNSVNYNWTFRTYGLVRHTLVDNNAFAFHVEDQGSVTLIQLNTFSNPNTLTIFGGAGAGQTIINMASATAGAFTVQDSAGADYIALNTSGSPPSIIFGNSSTNQLFNFSGSGRVLVPELQFPELGGDPAPVANAGALYTKDVSTVTHLFYEASNGTVYQITPPSVGAGISGNLWYINDDATVALEDAELRLGGGNGTDEFRTRFVTDNANRTIDLVMEDDVAGNGTFTPGAQTWRFGGTGVTSTRNTSLRVMSASGAATGYFDVTAQSSGGATISLDSTSDVLTMTTCQFTYTGAQWTFAGTDGVTWTMSPAQAYLTTIADNLSTAYRIQLGGINMLQIATTNNAEAVNIGNQSTCGVIQAVQGTGITLQPDDSFRLMLRGGESIGAADGGNIVFEAARASQTFEQIIRCDPSANADLATCVAIGNPGTAVSRLHVFGGTGWGTAVLAVFENIASTDDVTLGLRNSSGAIEWAIGIDSDQNDFGDHAFVFSYGDITFDAAGLERRFWIDRLNDGVGYLSDTAVDVDDRTLDHRVAFRQSAAAGTSTVDLVSPGTDTTVLYWARVTAADASTTEAAGFFIRGCAKNDAGTVTEVGAEDVTAFRDDAAWTAAISIVSGAVRLTLTGDSTNAVNWKVDWGYSQIDNSQTH